MFILFQSSKANSNKFINYLVASHHLIRSVYFFVYFFIFYTCSQLWKRTLFTHDSRFKQIARVCHARDPNLERGRANYLVPLEDVFHTPPSNEFKLKEEEDEIECEWARENQKVTTTYPEMFCVIVKSIMIVQIRVAKLC